jgi:multiple sugar transport system permease protein
VPLLMTLVLSLWHCQPVFTPRSVELDTPFGRESVLMQVRATDEAGQLQSTCRFAGALYYRGLVGLDAGAAASGSRHTLGHALGFTLRFVGLSTPLVLGIGLGLAWAVSRQSPRVRAACITAAMVPFMLTPVVGSLLFKWMFRDGGLVPGILQPLGLELHWMAHAWSAELVVLAYGVWQSAPFAFIVLYAGILGLPVEPLEAARVDGATSGQIFRLVVIPQLSPLLVFVTLIHVMDAYRVFEPVMVLTQGAFSVSVQYLAYEILLVEQNTHKASAAAVLTILGVAVLLAPMIRRTWLDHRRGNAR